MERSLIRSMVRRSFRFGWTKGLTIRVAAFGIKTSFATVAGSVNSGVAVPVVAAPARPAPVAAGLSNPPNLDPLLR